MQVSLRSLKGGQLTKVLPCLEGGGRIMHSFETCMEYLYETN